MSGPPPPGPGPDPLPDPDPRPDPATRSGPGPLPDPGAQSADGPGPLPEDDRPRPTAPPGPPRRPRAARTVATATVVTCLLVLAGALLYDAVAVRTGHTGSQWRTDVTRDLADRRVDDPWALGVAGGAVVLGVLLWVLAFAPGLRGWLPLRRPGAAVHRAGIEALIAARAAELPGVERCTVKAGRRKARATVTGIAEPAFVQRELREELARVHLAGPYRLDVRHRLSRPADPHDRRHGHRRLAQEAPR
ncbi:DUF6286 domain-containing protein [Kitasatospora sp. NBC_01539]|uniref:DUF6286 domain-containing protein n=1 Tax=Kitasatospora sp. NBC_01539 TaxID=2903577 RepID=UPI0038601753